MAESQYLLALQNREIKVEMDFYRRELVLAHTFCELCNANNYEIIVENNELEREQKQNYELSGRLYVRAPDRYVKTAVSYIQSYSSNLVKCRHCGLIYRNPKPQPSQIVDQYRNEEFTTEYELIWRISWGRIFTRQLRRIEKAVGKGRLLDLGSQLGLMPELAIQRGWDAYGIDVNSYTVKSAAKRGINIFHGELLEAKLPSNYFDAVTIMLLLENLPHFPSELRELYRVLKPGGLIVTKIVNVDFYIFTRKLADHAILNQCKWLSKMLLCRLHLLGYPYQYGFNRNTIKQALSSGGFVAVKVKNYQSVRSVDPYLKTYIKIVDLVGKLSINAVASIVYWVSIRRINIAPWLEIYAYKPKRPLSFCYPSLTPWLTKG